MTAKRPKKQARPILHKFSTNYLEGHTPYSGLIQGSDGTLYGTTWGSAGSFGGSDCGPGDPAWEAAAQVGEAFARAGWTLGNGGYGGTMLASAQVAVRWAVSMTPNSNSIDAPIMNLGLFIWLKPP